MNINSIKSFEEGAGLRERLKRKDADICERHLSGNSVGSEKIYEDKSGRVMKEDNSAAFSFSGGNLLASEGFGKILTFIDAHNQTANALTAFVMGGILRPGLTMALNLKEKKDKILSAIHAVVSAVLGLAVTMCVTQPIDDGIRKAVDKNPEYFGNKKVAEINKEIKLLEVTKTKDAAKRINDLKKQRETLKLIAKNFPEWLICIPRAMLTVALIPLFMRGITKLHDKVTENKKPKEQPIQQTANAANDNVENTAEKSDVNFKGKLNGYEKLTDWIAKKLISPFMNTKFLKENSWNWKDSEFLYDSMQTVTSFAISSTYAIRSYKNKKIDENDKNRKILALNHFTTWVISTAISLLAIKKLGIWWQRHPMAKLIEVRTNTPDFAKKYAEKHRELMDAAQKIANRKARKIKLRDARVYSAKDFYMDTVNKEGVNKELSSMLSGLGLFQKQLVWGTVTRMLVPLCSTIIASKVGRKVMDKRQAQREAKQADNIQNEQIIDKKSAA